MKYIITAIFFLFSLTLFSQDVGRRLTTGKVFHTQLGSGVGYFDVEITFTDEGGFFDGTSVAIGDYLFVSDGGFGYYLPITQVLSSGPVTCQIRVSNIGLPIGGISSDLGYVTKGTSKFKFIPYVGGLSNANQQINSEEFISRLDSILKFKLPERTSGSIPPAYTPSSTDSWIAQNASGDVYKFNGTTWSLVGGLVTTNAPLAGDGTSLDPVRLTASGVTSGTYGSNVDIPIITVDNYGRITTITTGTVADNSNSNEGRLGVGGSGVSTRTITTNTSGSNPINILAGTGIDLTGSIGGTNGGTIGIRNTGDLSTSNEGNLSLLPFGSNGGRITSNTSGSGSPKFVGTGNTTITVNNDTMFINTTSGISSVFTQAPITGDGTTGNRIRLDTTGLGDNEYVLGYNGSVWSASTLFSGGGITGNGTSTTPFQLDDLGATTGQVIKWNGSAWIASNDEIGFDVSTALGQDLTGTLPNPTVVGIRNTPVSSTAPTLNQILKFNGTQYVPAVDTFRWALKAPNGSFTAPSYTFENSQGTGMYAAQGAIPRMFLVGASSTTSTRGTGINLTAGSNSSTGVGGTIAFSAGSAVSSSGGAITFNAGAATSGSGGQITMQSGGSTSGAAGSFSITAGSGNTGGGVVITAGSSTGSVDGATVNITSGASTNATRKSGDIQLYAGNAPDTLYKGIVDIRLSNGIALPSINKAHAAGLNSKKVGQMIYTTRDTASNGKIGNVRIWNGTEWLPLYNPENTATSVAEPTNQIVYGTGSGVDSDNNYIRNPTNNDVSISGSNANLSVRTTDTLGIITTGLTGAPNKARIYHKANHAGGRTVYNYVEAPTISTKAANFNWIEQAIILPTSGNGGDNFPPGVVADTTPNLVWRRGLLDQNTSMFESDEMNWWGTRIFDFEQDRPYNYFEKHWHVIDSGGYEHRPLTGFFQKRANGNGNLAINVSLFDIDSWYINRTAVLTMNMSSETVSGQANIMNDSLYSLNLNNLSQNTVLHLAAANKTTSDPTGRANFITIGGNGSFNNAKVGIGALYNSSNLGGEMELITTTSNGGAPQKIRTRILGGATTLMSIGDHTPLQTLDVGGMAHIRGAVRANLTGDSTGLIIRRPSGTVFNTPIIQVRNFNETENFHISTWGTTSQTLTAGRIGGFQEGSHNNTVFGLTSVQFNAGYGNNSLFGFNTGGPSFQGYENTHVGAGAGRNTTGGFQNTNIGYNAGGSITTGYQNMFLGRQTGLNTTIGYGNTGIGANALRVNITGSHNLAIGTQAGENTTGNSNVYVGVAAGRTNNGSDNVFIGSYAGELQTGSNLLIIDNSNTSTPLIRGNFLADTLRVFGRLITGTLSGLNSPLLTISNNLSRHSLFSANTTPESNITGNQGDITLANVSGTGKLFGKKTGTGNTGWEEYISTPNIANLLTVGTGTDSTSIIQTNVSGANPITLKASKDLIISESGNTITLSSNPDVYEFNGWNAFTEECDPPSIVPDPLHGPFFAKDISPECGNIYQWNHYTEEWALWNFFTGNITLNPPNALTYVNSLGNVSPTSESYHSGNGAFYFRVPLSRRTSDRAPYTAGNDGAAMYAYHLNGTQHTEMRIASYGAGFDLHVEDHNQNESYSTYSTTYRSSATPGSYRAPVVGDLMFRELVRITRGNLPADPYDDACGFYPWDIKVASVGASNNVGTNVNFYTRKSTDPQSISGTGNLTLQLKENQDIRAVNYQLRNDAGTPTYIAGFNADGTFRSDLLSELAITETLGIDTDLGAPDGGLLTWDQTSGEWTGTQLAYHFEETNYSATAGATTFTIPITPATPTGSKMPIRVYRNGVKLIYTSGTPSVHQFSYTASTLTTSPCSAGDIISIEYLNY